MLAQPEQERFANAMRQYAARKGNVESPSRSNDRETFLFHLFSIRPRLAFALSVTLLIILICCLFCFTECEVCKMKFRVCV
jgi:hypothetical protein